MQAGHQTCNYVRISSIWLAISIWPQKQEDENALLTKGMKELIAQSKREEELLKQTEMEKGALLAELQEAMLARKSTQSEKETYLAELNKTREENKELRAQVKHHEIILMKDLL